jgi:hypothetical protein
MVTQQLGNNHTQDLQMLLASKDMIEDLMMTTANSLRMGSLICCSLIIVARCKPSEINAQI